MIYAIHFIQKEIMYKIWCINRFKACGLLKSAYRNAAHVTQVQRHWSDCVKNS